MEMRNPFYIKPCSHFFFFAFDPMYFAGIGLALDNSKSLLRQKELKSTVFLHLFNTERREQGIKKRKKS
jgi:hypothetical protein